MKGLWLIFAVVFFCSTTIGQQQTTAPAAGQFEVVEVYIDPHGLPLAAYQFELRAGAASIVGIEGGESAFTPAPYYDARALRSNHLIIAAFSLATDLPKAHTRVAKVSVLNETGRKINYSAKLIVAGTTNGTAIDASVSIGDGGSK